MLATLLAVDSSEPTRRTGRWSEVLVGDIKIGDNAENSLSDKVGDRRDC